ncbi:hypothetical protein IJ101_02210 [Candidatus Saccharibacteria bacterium]|nr:hypothetical protein [Candidatus Saccharibacteria bacterium]
MKVIHFISINKKFRIAGFLSAFLLLALSGLTIFPLSICQKQTKAIVHGEFGPEEGFDSSITLDITNSVASVDLTVTSSDGTFATSSAEDKAAFSITTDNYTGYTLSISAADDAGTLLNGSNSLDSIASNLTEAEFNTSANNGKWGYKPNKFYASNEVVDNTGDNAVFLSSPTTEATTLDVTNAANNEANEYDIALGARTDYSKPNGTYSKTFILTAVANKINYSVTYDANAGTDTVTNMPYESTNNVQSGDTNSTSITLSDLVPVREHYSFLGWCSTIPTTTDGVDSCYDTVYNPDGNGTDLTYGINQTTINTGTLYAMWERSVITWDIAYSEAGKEKSGDYYVLQDATYDICKAVTTGQTTTLIDNRDGSTYVVGKLADGNCWFLDNLKLDLVTVSLDNLVGKTNATDTTLGYLKNGGGTNPYTANAVSTSWSSGDSDFKNPKINKGSIDTSVTNYGVGSGKTGIFYNYCAASAGSYCYAVNAGKGNATEDICPAGWRLPTGGTSSTSEQNKLLQAYNNDLEDFRTAFSANLTGEWVNGSVSNKNKNGYYWSSTLYTTTSMYYLSLNTSTTSASDYNGRRYGDPVRCIMENRTISDISYMQEVTPAIANNTKKGTSASLLDKRDSEEYLVGKLEDGNIWMLDNLRLDLTQTSVLNALSSTNTNIALATEAATLKSLKQGNRTAGNQYATAGLSNWASSSTVSVPLIAVSGDCSGTNCVNYPSEGTWSKDAIATKYGNGSGKVGIYYNFCAASAGSYCYDSSAGTGNSIQDICPASWRIPTGGRYGEYQYLYNRYTSATEGQATAFRNALSTPLSGIFYGGWASDQESHGFFWSSTHSGDYMYRLSLDSSSADSLNTLDRFFGISVRCILAS